ARARRHPDFQPAGTDSHSCRQTDWQSPSVGGRSGNALSYRRRRNSDRSAFDPRARGNRARFRLEVKRQMADIFDITRRTFLRNSALLTAGTALAQAAELPQATQTAPPVFPYGAVYFRK